MKYFKLLALAITLTSLSEAAMAITANASARVLSPISVSESATLRFGSFISGGTSGTINQAGTTTGGVTAVTSTRGAASFSVTGDTNATGYTFTLPATATLTNGTPAQDMTATLSFASGTSSRTLTTGADTVTINGSLAVAANQAAALYTGTYTVTVAYN